MSTRYKNTVIAPSGNFGSLTVSGTQISLQDFTNWDTAYNWGDHATQNYLTDYTVTVHDVTGHEGSIEITESQITDLQDYLLASDIVSSTNWDATYVAVTGASANWDTAYNWGDHAAANYLTDYTVTVHDVTGHEGSIEITESQITDLQDYLLASDIVSADNWSLAYTTVTANSASWASHTDVTGLSNTVATNSSNWDVTYATVTAYSADWSTPGTTTLAGATDANITSPVKGEILVYTNGGTQKWTNKADRAGLEEMYNYANIQFYNELSYSSTDSTVLTGVDVYVTSAKATHLFSREFVYSTTDALTSIVTTDEQNNNTLTKNMYYHTTTGALTSVTRSYA